LMVLGKPSFLILPIITNPPF